MSARVGVVVFPGTNCEHDVVRAVEVLGGRADLVWHGDRALAGFDAVVVPGGFAHGDYLRTGAIARFSPVMEAVQRFADAGGPVVGICNGFQILTEAGLLPGALQKNAGLKFRCETVACRVATDRSALTRDTVTVVLQVKGKVRGQLEVPADTSGDELERLALASDVAQRWLEGTAPRRVIVVPGKLVNLVP